MRPLAPSQEEPPSATEEVARFRLRFRHIPLWELVSKGLLDWDKDEHVVKKGEQFDPKWDGIL